MSQPAGAKCQLKLCSPFAQTNFRLQMHVPMLSLNTPIPLQVLCYMLRKLLPGIKCFLHAWRPMISAHIHLFLGPQPYVASYSQVRHCAPECPAPQSLPQHKCGWHTIAAMIFGVMCSCEPVPVHYVDYASTPQYAPRQPWYPQENYYTQPEQPYHECQTQGNGEGLSMW